MSQKVEALGHIKVDGWDIPIKATHDVFTRYTYSLPENAVVLRDLLNIFYERYKEILVGMELEDPTVKIHTGQVEVESQYSHMLGESVREAKYQDIRMRLINDEDGRVIEIHFTEFQNDAHPDPPIEDQSLHYFGLGIGHQREEGVEAVSQRWVLAENRLSLTGGHEIINYTLRAMPPRSFPNKSGIMFICLPLVAQKDNGKAGQLAKFLLGIIDMPEHPEVKRIAEAIRNSFAKFKKDKEAINVLTWRERWEKNGKAVGEATANMATLVLSIEENDPEYIIERNAKRAGIGVDELQKMIMNIRGRNEPQPTPV